MADINQIPTELFDLDVTEVSYVGKGAIGEVFHIIKSEDFTEKNDEELPNGDSSDIVKAIQGLSDSEFVSIMGQMIQRYNQINKNEGGTNMEKDQIVQLVTEVCTEVIGKSMETVNKNFVAVNKSIDEIQKKFETEEKEKESASVPKEEEDEVKKAISEMGQSVKDLAGIVGTIGKSLEGFATLQTQVTKMVDETLPEISSRVEAIEKQEHPANGETNAEELAEVKKSAAKWPSFIRTAE